MNTQHKDFARNAFIALMIFAALAASLFDQMISLAMKIVNAVLS